MTGREGADDEAFAAERDRLFGLAYRMTGSVADADDVVQEAWLRWHGAERSTIESPAAWLTTVTSRLALDRLKSAQRRREAYVGPWLPEPLADVDPTAAVEDAETLTLGFLCVLDRLAPRERAAFLLHDVFGRSFAEVADVLDVGPDNARQIASRARRRVRDEHRTDRTPREDADRLVDAFLAAVLAGDEDRLVELLAADVIAVSDGGPDRHAARRPVVGADRVIRYFVNLSGRLESSAEVERCVVNGAPGLVVRSPIREPLVLGFDVHGDRITAIRTMLNPDKLGHFT